MSENYFWEICQEKGYGEEDLFLFREALALTQEKLGEKKRKAGDTFFDHNVRVGIILAEMHSVPEVVLAGLLHGIFDVVSEAVIKDKFGLEVVHLIQGAGEIKEIKEKNFKLEAEALRKIILMTFKDLRVIVVKLANKLDNLRSLKALSPEEQERIAREALEVYAPLANRLGMEKMKVQLEDQALQILDPVDYRRIVKFLEESGSQRERYLEEAFRIIRQVAEPNLKIVSLKGRLKHVYSIYKKVKNKNLKLQELYDLVGVRVIVPEVKDCYMLLGILHEKFEPEEGRLKDYIANPKPNFYRSIHTAVHLPNQKIVEVQIRTPEMDEFAEEGIAAHWKYKGIKSEESFEKKIAWLRGVLDLQKQEDTQELLEDAKVDVFGDEIYCYTPKGSVKELPVGATVLDFAYAVHEDIGGQAVGGRINGKFVPLKSVLSSGDVVEIITNKNQRPRMSWLKIVKSGRAKQKIRKVLKQNNKLPTFIYRSFKPSVEEGQGLLLESEDFPKAVCVLAKCCSALPGDAATGLATKRRVISVHRTDCRLALNEEERWVDVKWKESFNQMIKFHVMAKERSGVLADLLHTIATAGFEVKEAKAKLLDKENTQNSFLVVPRSLKYLIEMILRVKKVRGVTKIYFE